MSDFRPKYLVLHDYGVPSGVNLSKTAANPYHALVYSDGSIRFRYPDDPYGQKAPHAYQLNPESIGLSYAGPVGETPTPAAMKTLKAEFTKINDLFPGIKALGHGEAYQQTKGTSRQASKHGRDLIEASWRTQLTRPDGTTQTIAAAPTTAPVPASRLDGAQFNTGGLTTSAPPREPTPMQNRGLVTFAGLKDEMPSPMALGGPQQAAGKQTIALGGLSPDDTTAALQRAYDAGNRSMVYINDSNPRVIAKPGEPSWAPVGDKTNYSGPQFANHFLTKNKYPGAVGIPDEQPVPTPVVAERPANPASHPSEFTPVQAARAPEPEKRPAIMEAPIGTTPTPGPERQMQDQPLLQQAPAFTPLPDNLGFSQQESAAAPPTIKQDGSGAGWRDQPPGVGSGVTPQNQALAKALRSGTEQMTHPQWMSNPNGIKWKNGDFTAIGLR